MLIAECNHAKAKISKHTARKRSSTNQLNEKVNPLHVQQISDHKKIESLNQNNSSSLQQQKLMSQVTSNVQPQNLMNKSISVCPGTTTTDNFSTFHGVGLTLAIQTIIHLVNLHYPKGAE